MTVKLKIHGQADDRDLAATRDGSAGADRGAPVTDLFREVKVVQSFSLSASARARAEAPVDVELEDDDVMEIEVEGGFTVWTSAQRYSAELPLLRPEARAPDGSVSVDTLPRVGDRGLAEVLAGGLRVLRIGRDAIAEAVADPKRWPADLRALASGMGIDLAVKVPAWLLSKVAIRLIEDRLNPGPGLYTWADATRKPEGNARPAPVSLEGHDVEKPMLVFIHGTLSSTIGSFGAFLADEAQPQWQALVQRFGDRIYAFEHRSTSDSPIDNAIDLVSALPRNARVNIVSHSRGGLIGDLISLKSIGAHLIDRFRRDDGAGELAKVDARDRAQLQKLAGLIAQKQLRIERFVRCASPSRGTLFVSGNLDNFLSVITNLVGLIPGVGGTPLYEVTKRITLEIVRNRTDPALVPGVEAVMPSSPLVAMLNDADGQAAGAVGVLSGDIEGGNWLRRLGVFVTDQFLYEGRDNDLVVNTDAMFSGARHDQRCYVFDQGSDVSHFNYFRNARTRAALVEWLSAGPGVRPEIFHDIPEGELEPVPMLRSMQLRSGADQPIVFVLPGIMGSHLNVGDRAVWLRHLALLRGGLRDLADVEAANVMPVALVGDAYRELCEFLQTSHEVIPFAYDWRRSVAAAAQALALEVEKALARTRQPVRIVAHSMGGLVARAMMRARPELWERMCERDGARLVLLGTPNRGSHDIVEALLGTATSIQQLALVDLTQGTRDITGIIAGFPGVLELLPQEPRFFEDAIWKDYGAKVRNAAVPAGARLAAAQGTTRTLAADTAMPHADRIHYVAGSSGRTTTGVADIVKGRVVLSVTTEGDGRVTYQSGRLPGVAMWYTDAVHGDLASHAPAFPGIRELLETGTTRRLSTSPPSAARGGEVNYRALPEPVLYPTETSLAGGLLGKQPRRAYKRRGQPSFRVSVVHGDLRFARFPIVVGHYEGDTIIGAEAQIDGLLGGALSERYALGLYPGEFGSLTVILREPSAVQKALALPSGAIVIGLGKWGDLTAGQLGDLLRRASLQYVLQLRDFRAASRQADAIAAPVGVSVLLIGGNSTTNIAVGDSVGAILRAVAQANRELSGREGEASVISDVEIVELYADTAIEAAHAVKRLSKLIGDELESEIEAAPLLQRGRDGRRRLTAMAGRDAWRRWEISVVAPERRPPPAQLPKPLAERLKRAVLDSGSTDAELLAALAELAIGAPTDTPEPYREIRFLTLSDRARAEATAQQRQPELVERLIKDSISQPRFREEDSRVLFELTVPNELKSGLAQLDNLVLVLDAETAAYPWELMSAGNRPLCLAKGLVRQLQTSRYRPQIGARAGTAAYIVGDPTVTPPFRQLPGARDEAIAVYGLLRKRFDVMEPEPQPTALQVLAGLYEKPYRIVHLAGHGHYEPPTTAGGKARSGMVLDNGVFLTAVEVGQMQQVPELVFLNCCHIGQTGPEAPARVRGVEFNRLAASVSRELIEMGVRAVVAAGWAVNDSAAKVFAEVFYAELLDGATFGRALKAARERTHDAFPESNTWGAYQAYGDPDYRLDPTQPGGGAALAGHVDPAELIDAVERIARKGAEAARAGGRDRPKHSAAAVTELELLLKDCPAEWLAQTDVLMAIGYAFGNLGAFDAANRYLAAALAGEGDDNTTTLRAVEQLANFEARLAEDRGDEADALREAAIARLEKLLAVASTAERQSLLGSVYKRRAVAERDASKATEALEKAAEGYRSAHARNLARKDFDPYPTLNWLMIEAVLGKRVGDGDALADRCEAVASERFHRDRRFFDAIGIADAALVRALLSARLEADEKTGKAEVARLAEAYRDVIGRAGPTPRELDSVTRHFDDLAALIGKLRPAGAATRSIVARLAELRNTVTGNPASGSGEDRGPQRQRAAKAAPAVSDAPPKAKPAAATKRARKNAKPKPPRTGGGLSS
jgi:CHAT domain-containing protein/pimeloyl-ACP methyl ester carboxylesterase